MAKFFMGLVIGLFLVPIGVGAAQKVFDTSIKIYEGSSGVVRRFDDPDFQVKCWDLEGTYAGGISCLPWSEVKER